MSKDGLKVVGAFILLAIVAVGVGQCMQKDEPLAVDYDADFYTCGEPPNDTLFYCVPGTGPPREDCVANGSGTTQTAPITC